MGNDYNVKKNIVLVNFSKLNRDNLSRFNFENWLF